MADILAGDEKTRLSCRNISNQLDWFAVINEAERSAQDAGQRALILIESTRPPTASTVLVGSTSGQPDAPARQALDAEDTGLAARADHVDIMTARLGREFTRVLHDARDGIDPDMLATDVRALVRGGVLVFLLPIDCRSRFATRTTRLLRDFRATRANLSWLVDIDAGSVDTIVGHEIAASTVSLTVPITGKELPVNIGDVESTSHARAEQDTLLDKLEARLLSGQQTLAVVEAPRGHGKSALLGRLAARLDAQTLSWQITAARRVSLNSFARHWCADGRNGESTRLPFAPPDAIKPGQTDVLLIDEAASLPLPVLERLIGGDSRVVMSTTTDGNEAAGRAFAVRLPDTFDRLRPGWCRVSPARPWRWRPDDSLAHLLDEILASDAATLALAPLPLIDSDLHRLRRTNAVHELDREKLLDDEATLRAVHGLLSATHYQSMLSDLARLLDTPALRVWTIMSRERCVAAALVAIEDGLDVHLHDDVLARRRRPHHCLLPVLLAQTANTAIALGASAARVVRIAVHPDARRAGLGSCLLDRITTDLGGSVEAIGASFGENTATCAFWDRNGFTPFHRGFRRNPRSGQHSLAVLRAMSQRTRTALDEAADIHRDNIRHRRPTTLTDEIDDAIAPFSSDRSIAPLSPRDMQLLVRFGHGERSLSDTLGPLCRLTAIEGYAARDVQHALASGKLALILPLLDLGRSSSRKLSLALLRGWTLELVAQADTIQPG